MQAKIKAADKTQWLQALGFVCLIDNSLIVKESIMNVTRTTAKQPENSTVYRLTRWLIWQIVLSPTRWRMCKNDIETGHCRTQCLLKSRVQQLRD